MTYIYTDPRKKGKKKRVKDKEKKRVKMEKKSADRAIPVKLKKEAALKKSKPLQYSHPYG